MRMSSTPPEGAPAVLLERVGEHIAVVTLNRPEAHNAINGAVAQALDAIVEETENDPDIWVVVLTGAGEGVFCAGAEFCSSTSRAQYNSSAIAPSQ